MFVGRKNSRVPDRLGAGKVVGLPSRAAWNSPRENAGGQRPVRFYNTRRAVTLLLRKPRPVCFADMYTVKHIWDYVTCQLM